MKKIPRFNVHDTVFCLDRGKIIQGVVVHVEHNEFLEDGTSEIIIETNYGIRPIRNPSCDHDFQRDTSSVFASREELIASL